MEIVSGAMMRQKQRGDIVLVMPIRAFPRCTNLPHVQCRVPGTDPADCSFFARPERLRVQLDQLIEFA